MQGCTNCLEGTKCCVNPVSGRHGGEIRIKLRRAIILIFDRPCTVYLSHPILFPPLFVIFCLPLSGVIDNRTPSMKVKKVGIFWDKIGSACCKWSNWNTPGTESPFSHPFLVNSILNFVIFCLPLSLNGCKWSNSNTPGTEPPVSHPFLVNSPL